jgi:MATE family multidrug resistance protein
MADRAAAGTTRAAGPLAPRLLGEWRALFALAWPVILSRAGMVVMAMADVVMVGRYDTDALAALSLGNAVFMPLLVAGIGCMVGVVATAARAAGSHDPELPAIALRGLRWAGLVGGIASFGVLGAGPILRVIGQAPELVAGGAAVAHMLAAGAVMQIVFTAASFYLEGTGRPKPGLVAMAAANLLNIGLNWLLIGGRWGAPELGAPGAALATTLSRLVMVAGLVVWMLRLPEFAPWRGRAMKLWGPGGWAAGDEMRRIGLAGGAAYFFETVAFAAMAQAAGLLGATALAAYTILHNVETTVFMIALGLSVATAVRVGQAAGAGHGAGARFAGLAGLSAAMGTVAVVGLAMLAAAPTVVGFYSSDPGLIARAAPLLAILAISMVFDAGQVILGQSTRALGDSWATTACFFLAFWCVMIPASLLLAFHTPLAEGGLFIGTGLGCATAVLLLGTRFLRLSARV